MCEETIQVAASSLRNVSTREQMLQIDDIAKSRNETVQREMDVMRDLRSNSPTEKLKQLKADRTKLRRNVSTQVHSLANSPKVKLRLKNEGFLNKIKAFTTTDLIFKYELDEDKDE